MDRIAAEGHRVGRSGALRAGVLGANDGLLSTGSLLLGVAAANVGRSTLLTTGVAALVAGALSMAVGEYSSVSSQRDVEFADIARETVELEETPEAEKRELAGIYRRRGLSVELAQKVADELSAGDALRAHARDELSLDLEDLSRPTQAAVVSAVSFVLGAAVPLLITIFAPSNWRIAAIVVSVIGGLGALGTLGAQVGGAPRTRGALRVLIGGAAALAATYVIGKLSGNYF